MGGPLSPSDPTRPAWRWTALWALGLAVLVSIEVRGRGDEHVLLVRGLLTVAAPPLKAWQGARRFTAESLRSLAELFDLHSRQNNLEDENARLRERITTLERAESENVRLRKLLGFRGEPGLEHALLARVLLLRRDENGRVAIVDLGTESGVHPPAAAIHPLGIAGRVTSSGIGASRVILLTDPRFGAGIRIDRTRQLGVVAGAGDDGVIAKGFAATDDLRIGDRVVTSGLEGIFPPGLAVGEVVALDPGPGAMILARVKPSAPLAQLEDLMLLPAQAATAEEVAP